MEKQKSNVLVRIKIKDDLLVSSWSNVEWEIKCRHLSFYTLSASATVKWRHTDSFCMILSKKYDFSLVWIFWERKSLVPSNFPDTQKEVDFKMEVLQNCSFFGVRSFRHISLVDYLLFSRPGNRTTLGPLRTYFYCCRIVGVIPVIL